MRHTPCLLWHGTICCTRVPQKSVAQLFQQQVTELLIQEWSEMQVVNICQWGKTCAVRRLHYGAGISHIKTYSRCMRLLHLAVLLIRSPFTILEETECLPDDICLQLALAILPDLRRHALHICFYASLKSMQHPYDFSIKNGSGSFLQVPYRSLQICWHA